MYTLHTWFGIIRSFYFHLTAGYYGNWICVVRRTGKWGLGNIGHPICCKTSQVHLMHWWLPSWAFTIFLRPTQTVPGKLSQFQNQCNLPQIEDMCDDLIPYLLLLPELFLYLIFPFVFISALFFLTSEFFTPPPPRCHRLWQYFAIFSTLFGIHSPLWTTAPNSHAH